jgi:hypothetical protein
MILLSILSDISIAHEIAVVQSMTDIGPTENHPHKTEF